MYNGLLKIPQITIQVDAASATPLYRQIENAIRTLLVEGTLKPGHRLPPVRSLAVDLIVHHNTVAQAYRELEAEGWLELVRGRGAIVRDRGEPAPTRKTKATFSQRLRELIARARADGMDRKSIAAVLKGLALQEKGGKA